MRKYDYRELKPIFNKYGFKIHRYDDYKVASIYSKAVAAKELGISRPTLNKWLERFVDDHDLIIDEHFDMLADGDTTMLEDL